MTVLCVFKEGERFPRPLKFKIMDAGEEKTVEVAEITNMQDMGAGGMARIEYTCSSPGSRGKIRYKLKYYYEKGSWELERTQ